MAVGFSLWLLRQVCDVEKEETYRNSDRLDELSLNPESFSRHAYIAVEDDYLNCECALGFLESAIEDLELAY